MARSYLLKLVAAKEQVWLLQFQDNLVGEDWWPLRKFIDEDLFDTEKLPSSTDSFKTCFGKRNKPVQGYKVEIENKKVWDVHFSDPRSDAILGTFAIQIWRGRIMRSRKMIYFVQWLDWIASTSKVSQNVAISSQSLICMDDRYKKSTHDVRHLLLLEDSGFDLPLYASDEIFQGAYHDDFYFRKYTVDGICRN